MAGSSELVDCRRLRSHSASDVILASSAFNARANSEKSVVLSSTSKIILIPIASIDCNQNAEEAHTKQPKLASLLCLHARMRHFCQSIQRVARAHAIRSWAAGQPGTRRPPCPTQHDQRIPAGDRCRFNYGWAKEWRWVTTERGGSHLRFGRKGQGMAQSRLSMHQIKDNPGLSALGLSKRRVAARAGLARR